MSRLPLCSEGLVMGCAPHGERHMAGILQAWQLTEHSHFQHVTTQHKNIKIKLNEVSKILEASAIKLSNIIYHFRSDVTSHKKKWSRNWQLLPTSEMLINWVNSWFSQLCWRRRNLYGGGSCTAWSTVKPTQSGPWGHNHKNTDTAN